MDSAMPFDEAKAILTSMFPAMDEETIGGEEHA